MGLGTNQFTQDDLAVMRPEIWGQKLNDFYKSKLKAANFFWDLSDALLEGGDQVNVPNLTEMAASDKVNGSEITLVSPTETDVNLAVATWKETSFLN